MTSSTSSLFSIAAKVECGSKDPAAKPFNSDFARSLEEQFLFQAERQFDVGIRRPSISLSLPDPGAGEALLSIDAMLVFELVVNTDNQVNPTLEDVTGLYQSLLEQNFVTTSVFPPSKVRDLQFSHRLQEPEKPSREGSNQRVLTIGPPAFR